MAADGGVFAFTAPWYGSTGGDPPAHAVLGLVATPQDLGYGIVDEAGTSAEYGG